MIDKIYQEFLEKQGKAMKQERALFGIHDEIGNLEDMTPKPNYDMMTILSNLNLVEKNDETLDKINEYFEEQFKLGIKQGIADGKYHVIKSIQNDEVSIDEIMEYNTEECMDYEIKCEFINYLEKKVKL